MAKMGSGPALRVMGNAGPRAAMAGGPGLQDNNALLDKAKIRENTIKKWLRVGTVGAYLFFVSLTAIVLAIYYGVFWKHQGKNAVVTTDSISEENNITTIPAD